MCELQRSMMRSSSFGKIEVDLSTLRAPLVLPKKKNPKPTLSDTANSGDPKAEEPSSSVPKKEKREEGGSIFFLESPPREKAAEEDRSWWEFGYEWFNKNQNEEYGKFFKTCYLCKEKIAPFEDVLMYGYLRAFCGYNCRSLQFCCDEIQNQKRPFHKVHKFPGNYDPNDANKTAPLRRVKPSRRASLETITVKI